MSDFEKVVDFLTSYGVSVKLGKRTSYDVSSSTITIHHAYNRHRNGLYALLHEAGHSQQPESSTGVNRYQLIDSNEYPREYAMHQFLNELDAWNRAIHIADSLNLNIKPRDFNKFREKCLLSYFSA
jgi:hypothetical protein